MKKIFLLVCAMVVGACAAPPTNRESVATNRSSELAAAPLTEADAIAKEKSVWDTLRRKDYDGFAGMLATDYVEVGSDGVFDKTGIVSYVKDLDFTDVTFADWRLIPIDSDAALITYTVTTKGTFKGAPFPPGPYRATGGWVKRDGKWQSIYYQQTEVKPAPTAAASPAASPATRGASPAASPATTVSPAATAAAPADPIEREKMVWDALKRRDYDAFASYLDASQVEVESDGIHDKASTLSNVRGFDASRGELSEFKTVKFDADAELVTYLVTVPGTPSGTHRATTVWVNRGGKWQALFHQGTEVAPAAGSPSPTTSAK